MLFQRRFHAGLLDGTIDRTFRVWETPKVRVGGVYRVAGVGALIVKSVRSVALGAIGSRDARRAGFEDEEELRKTLAKHARKQLTARSSVVRVTFRLARADEIEAPTELTVAEALERLAAMDRRSRRGPWTKAVLQLIAKHARTAASSLAPKLDRERLAFKADVRKLKKLGLTESFETGYGLTPLGKRVLRQL